MVTDDVDAFIRLPSRCQIRLAYIDASQSSHSSRPPPKLNNLGFAQMSSPAEE
ncbi:uncharacterized protein FFB20_12798 [Fusarium fujikuroi]|nr:uncharacterized protein FFB20_12798 [Fusarium fujikuroi]SCO54745.1 uncharacterized protein FFNC_15646 [Fusarium fujikuroi]